MNPLYKESLSQLIEAGKKVVDNPTHLADFGKQSSNTFFLDVNLDEELNIVQTTEP